MELLDGVFYDMAAPTPVHQVIIKQILKALDDFVEDNNGKCIALGSPVDVQLFEDTEEMVEPDVVVVCDKEKFRNGKNIQGAPDLAVEVISPSETAKKIGKKRMKYKDAGVREYWEIDPANRSVLVYRFGDSTKVEGYTFEDEVPVGIWNGACKVDFKKIVRRLDELPFKWQEM